MKRACPLRGRALCFMLLELRQIAGNRCGQHDGLAADAFGIAQRAKIDMQDGIRSQLIAAERPLQSVDGTGRATFGLGVLEKQLFNRDFFLFGFHFEFFLSNLD